MEEYLKLFLLAFFMPILPLIVCGLLVGLCEKLFMKMTGRFGRGFFIATSIICTPVHELGHALMCIPFGHKIKEMKLWDPSGRDGVMGYVNHSYNKKNFWQRLGNLFIGLGPIILGLAVVTLIMKLCFPEALSNYLSRMLSLDRSAAGILPMIGEGFKMIFVSVSDGTRPLWAKIAGLVLILCVCMHINLSFADIRGSLGAIPFYAIICLAVSSIMFFVNLDGFSKFLVSSCFVGFGLYTVVIAGVFLLLALALICFILGKVLKK